MACLRTKDLLEPITQQGSFIVTTKTPSTSEVDALQSGLNSDPHPYKVTVVLPIQRWSCFPILEAGLALGLALANRMWWK